MEGEVSGDLLCSFCRGVLEKPVRSKCGHVFCKPCLEAPLLRECPVCDVELSSSSSGKQQGQPVDEELVRKLGELSLHCSHQKEGCEAVVTYHSLEEHMVVECKFRLVPCKHRNCKEFVPHASLDSHMEKCDHRLVECKVCKACVPRKDMPAHQAVKRCFEQLNKRRMVRSARRLSQELREHQVELVQQRHFTEQAERALVRSHYSGGGEGGIPRHQRAMSAGPVLMRSSVQSRVGSAHVIPHYSRNLKSAALDSCRECTNRFTHGRRPSARRHSHINVSKEGLPGDKAKLLLS